MGFQTTRGGKVSYQDPFTMFRQTQAVNLRAVQVSDADALLRHAQMMPYWFVPHELVHCARARFGWSEEFIANQIQPHLTDRILAEIDSPYSPAFMEAVYDRYARQLRPILMDAQAAGVERAIWSDGAHQPFEGHDAYDFFLQHTAAYVYFIALVNQESLDRNYTLEDLARKFRK